MAIAFADAIEPMQDLGGAISYPISYGLEESGQTFVYGTPLMIASGDGGVEVWNGTSLSNAIAGIAAQNANNLSSTGYGAPQGFSPVLGPGSVIGSYPANPYQASAVITPPGVPFTDGYLLFYLPYPTTLFVGRIGTSASNTPVATAATQRGVSYGLTKDSLSNYWYVDTDKTGASAAVMVQNFFPNEVIGTVGGHVIFSFLPGVISQQA